MADPGELMTQPAPPQLDAASPVAVDRWFGWWGDRPVWALVAISVLALPLINPFFWPEFDAHSFLSIARSVWEEHGLRRFGSEQLYFIPGYPLLVSPAFLLGDRPFLALSLIQYALLVALACGVYAWASAFFDRRLALLIAALVTLNPGTWLLYRPATSEAAFMPAMVWGAYLLNRVLKLDRDAPMRRALLGAAGASLMVTIATTMRYPGVFLASGFVIALGLSAWRRSIPWTRAAVLAVIVGAPPVAAAGGFILHDRSLAQAATTDEPALTYTEQIVDDDHPLPAQLAEGVRLRVSEVGRLMIPGLFKSYGDAGDWLNPIIAPYLIVTVLVGWGVVLLARGGRDVFAWAAPFYVALYLIWPWDAGTRFMAPLQPLLWAGAVWLALTWRPRARLAPALVVLAALHLTVAWGHLASEYPEAIELDRCWVAIDAGMKATGAQVDHVAVVDMPKDLYNMVVFAYDDRPHRLDDSAVSPGDIRWLYAPADEEVPDGFTLVTADERLTFWQAIDER